jgi:hypothetical protein
MESRALHCSLAGLRGRSWAEGRSPRVGAGPPPESLETNLCSGQRLMGDRTVSKSLPIAQLKGHLYWIPQ